MVWKETQILELDGTPRNALFCFLMITNRNLYYYDWHLRNPGLLVYEKVGSKWQLRPAPIHLNPNPDRALRIAPGNEYFYEPFWTGLGGSAEASFFQIYTFGTYEDEGRLTRHPVPTPADKTAEFARLYDASSKYIFATARNSNDEPPAVFIFERLGPRNWNMGWTLPIDPAFNVPNLDVVPRIGDPCAAVLYQHAKVVFYRKSVDNWVEQQQIHFRGVPYRLFLRNAFGDDF